MVKIEFKTGNAAFCNEFTGNPDVYSERMEIKRILEKICADIEDGKTGGSVMDYNGNHIGKWSI